MARDRAGRVAGSRSAYRRPDFAGDNLNGARHMKFVERESASQAAISACMPSSF